MKLLSRRAPPAERPKKMLPLLLLLQPAWAADEFVARRGSRLYLGGERYRFGGGNIYWRAPASTHARDARRGRVAGWAAARTAR